MDVKDKVAVVTGGASGIGRGIALALAEKGAHVVVADIEDARAQAVADEVGRHGVRTLAVACDVSQLESVEALADSAWKEFGRVDILFNNAGVSATAPLLDASPADLRWLFQVNVFGVWYGCWVFGRRFRDQGTPACIVNTGSEHSLGVPHLQASIYTATKHAVLAISDVLRREARDLIQVGILCPGIVKSELWDATRNRPAELGGAVHPPDVFRDIQYQGMDPLDIGRRAVAGVERGDFYIMTHPHVRSFVEERYTEMRAALDAQAPRQAGDEEYDVNAIVSRVLGFSPGR